MPVVEIQNGAHKDKLLVSDDEAKHLSRNDRLLLPVNSGGQREYIIVHVERVWGLNP